MATVLSTGLRNHILNSTGNSAAGINFDSGSLQIRTGAAPGPDAAVAGTLIVDIPLPADAFDNAASGAMAKLGTWSADADNSGTAAHFRLARSGDAGGSSSDR